MRTENPFLIDTNFILRLLIGDVPTQLEKSRKLFKKIEEKEAAGLISILVINELIWILEHFYHRKRQDFIPLVLKLISLKNIKILEIKKKELTLILEKMEKTSLDFTDLYLLYFKKGKDRPSESEGGMKPIQQFAPKARTKRNRVPPRRGGVGIYFGEKLQYGVASFDRKLLKAEFQGG